MKMSSDSSQRDTSKQRHMVLSKKLLAGFGILGIVDTVFIVAIAGGMHTGTLLPGIAGTVLASWAVYTGRSPLTFSYLRHWNLKTCFFLACLAWAVSFVAVQALILTYAFTGEEQEADWCMVLGAGLRDDHPSLTLQRRLAVAHRYLTKYPRARVIVTGGQGRNETLSEAEGMRRALLGKGVAPARIHLEDQATSTFENLCFSRKVMLEAGGTPQEHVAVITSNYHLLRVRLLAQRAGLRIWCIPAPTPWYLLPNVCLREYLALVKSLLVDW